MNAVECTRFQKAATKGIIWCLTHAATPSEAKQAGMISEQTLRHLAQGLYKGEATSSEHEQCLRLKCCIDSLWFNLTPEENLRLSPCFAAAGITVQSFGRASGD